MPVICLALLRSPALILLAAVSALGAMAGARSLYLNGVDISSARSQSLKNVDVHINEQGDVFIIAPHYQVNEEDTYVPLSKYVQGLNGPAHKPPQAMGELAKTEKPAQPAAKPEDAPRSSPTPMPEPEPEPGPSAASKPAEAKSDAGAPPSPGEGPAAKPGADAPDEEEP